MKLWRILHLRAGGVIAAGAVVVKEGVLAVGALDAVVVLVEVVDIEVGLEVMLTIVGCWLVLAAVVVAAIYFKRV